MATRDRDYYKLFLVVAAARRRRALELHEKGKTYAEIGADLSVTRQRAFRMVRRAKATISNAQ